MLPAPLAVAGFLLAGLVAWQYLILIGLVPCWLGVFLLFGVFLAGSLCCNVCWFACCWMLAFMSFLLGSAFASLSLQPLSIAHCCKTLSFDRLVYCVVVFWLVGYHFTKVLY